MICLLICLVIKKINLIVTELFIRGRKLNIYLDFITDLFLLFQKLLDLIQQINAFNHPSDIDF